MRGISLLFKKDTEKFYRENEHFFEISLKKQFNKEKKEKESTTSKKKALTAKEMKTEEKERSRENTVKKAFEFQDYGLLSEPLNLSNVMMNEQSPNILSTAIKKSKFNLKIRI